MDELRPILSRVPVIPVLTIEHLEHAAPLARALVAGGIDVLELTLRTPVAGQALAAMCTAVPQAIIGAGTVVEPRQLDQALEAGARFAVSPGFDPRLVRQASTIGLPLLPGVMTPSEAMQAHALGCSTLKLFPASVAGGIPWLRAIHGPLPELAFCPTGGISHDQVADYRALPNVLCVGGSWLAPRALLMNEDWSAITRLAAQAVATAQRIPPADGLAPPGGAPAMTGEEDPGAGIDV